jgi:hypothetical protein
MITFAKHKKYEHGGRLKVEIHILFYGDKLWTVALKLDELSFMDLPTSLI